MPGGNVPIAQRQAGIYFAFAFEQLTVTSATKVLTAATYQVGDKKAQIAFITVEDYDIRYTYDGTAPSGTNGHLATAGTAITLFGVHDIENFQAYLDGGAGGNSTISVTYEG
jgi:hypothetical protein